jgi:hypothetical protein
VKGGQQSSGAPLIGRSINDARRNGVLQQAQAKRKAACAALREFPQFSYFCVFLFFVQTMVRIVFP